MNNKDKIAEATFSLALKYGFDNVSLKQIQDTANVTTGAVYYHFKDKNDILKHMVEMYLLNEVKNFKKILKNHEGTPIEKLRFTFYYHTGLNIGDYSNILELSDKSHVDYKEYYLLLMGVYHQHPELRDVFHDMNLEIFNFYKELIEESIEKKEIKEDIDSEELAIYIFTIFMGFIELSTVFPKFSLEKIIETNLKMIWENIKK
ncbi:hypothetical protein SDC9_08567 [bioreactor metagenome]|uniref:HTH tetR-type domain-containing protein n=1 Tax=bioreactor metagenome TaxID=1076179 RepID=A0A644T8Y8_9ZZZZ|nr:TetR/AcrR family transcriptional regulator [Methanobrevibacter sp.]MEA4957457.1 TetR/AcrR family transcriptional regulator [Methanobrevibacter sp.]